MIAVIIEDMENARELLTNDLQTCCPEVKVAGSASGVIEAAKLLRKVSPDIVFLDVVLEDGTGFDLLQILSEWNFKVIFTTASDEYALRAFKYAAVDYLLKPIDPLALKAAVERAKAQLTVNRESIELLNETINEPHQLPRRISLHSLEKIEIVKIEEIIHCMAEANNTIFRLKDRPNIFVTRTLKHFDGLLNEHGFLRVHQSHLVNGRYIRAFLKKDGGYLLLENGDEVPVSVRKKAEVMEFLQRLS